MPLLTSPGSLSTLENQPFTFEKTSQSISQGGGRSLRFWVTFPIKGFKKCPKNFTAPLVFVYHNPWGASGPKSSQSSIPRGEWYAQG